MEWSTAIQLTSYTRMCWVQSAFRNSETHPSQFPLFWLVYQSPFLVYHCTYMTCGKEDVDELTDFFTTWGLFLPDTTLHCHCIATGAVASTSVTVGDDAQSTGMGILKGMLDLWVREYIFPVSYKAKSLAARLEVEMNEEKVSVYPNPLFQRLSMATSTKTDGARQESFAYELCS